MTQPSPSARPWSARFCPAALLVAILIAYGSLYPFDFRVPSPDIGPVARLLASWQERPGRGDFIANILLYVPFGFFALHAIRRSLSVAVALAPAVIVGALLSLAIELGQYYDAGRVPTVGDICANTIGALVGSLAATAVGSRFRLPFIRDIQANPIPTLLLLTWLAYWLYPYVPTTDRRHFWGALKPLLAAPSMHAYDLFRQTTIWLTLYALIAAIVGGRRSAMLALAFAVAALCAKVVTIDGVLRVADLAGAGIGLILLLVLRTLPERLRAGVAALALCTCVAAQRLEPFRFQPVAQDFGWVPFLSLMHGTLMVTALSFMETLFLFGSMVYLLGTALARMAPAACLVAALVIATSWAQTYLPDRSADITDTVMVLAVAALLVARAAVRDPQVSRVGNLDTWRVRGWWRQQARALGVKLDG